MKPTSPTLGFVFWTAVLWLFSWHIGRHLWSRLVARRRAPRRRTRACCCLSHLLIETQFETARRSNEGLLWAAVRPPFLNLFGIALVYFLPASVAMLWSLRAKRS